MFAGGYKGLDDSSAQGSRVQKSVCLGTQDDTSAAQHASEVNDCGHHEDGAHGDVMPDGLAIVRRWSVGCSQGEVDSLRMSEWIHNGDDRLVVIVAFGK